MNDTANEGVLQMYTNHSWNTFCDDTFGYEEAVTACRQLHLPTYEYYNSLKLLQTQIKITTGNKKSMHLRARYIKTMTLYIPI